MDKTSFTLYPDLNPHSRADSHLNHNPHTRLPGPQTAACFSAAFADGGAAGNRPHCPAPLRGTRTALGKWQQPLLSVSCLVILRPSSRCLPLLSLSFAVVMHYIHERRLCFSLLLLVSSCHCYLPPAATVLLAS